MLIKRYESGVLSSFLRGTCGGALANVSGRSGSTNSAITPEQASQLTLEQVQQIADHAEQHSLGIVEHMSDFYALHSGLIKTLVGAALTIALAMAVPISITRSINS